MMSMLILCSHFYCCDTFQLLIYYCWLNFAHFDLKVTEFLNLTADLILQIMDYENS